MWHNSAVLCIPRGLVAGGATYRLKGMRARDERTFLTKFYLWRRETADFLHWASTCNVQREGLPFEIDVCIAEKSLTHIICEPSRGSSRHCVKTHGTEMSANVKVLTARVCWRFWLLPSWLMDDLVFCEHRCPMPIFMGYISPKFDALLDNTYHRSKW